MRTVFFSFDRTKKWFAFAFLGFVAMVFMTFRTRQNIAHPLVQRAEEIDQSVVKSFEQLLQQLDPAKSRLPRTPMDPKRYFVGLHHTSNEKIANPPGHRPTILIWEGQFGSHGTYLANPEVCGGDIYCDITYDRNLFNTSGAIVFHFTGARLRAMPPRRRPDQLFLWWTLEKDHGSKMKEFNNVFNLTFSYRSDSGIYSPYGSIHLILQELRKANELDLESLLEKKRKSGKIAAWAVSNCGVKRRNDLVKSMVAAGLELETFGRCFGGRKIGDGTYSDSFYAALSQYKFYFAFENGYHCKDYMTEKFWFNGLRSGAVPIVFGPLKEDVAAVAPKNSFIHVEDFSDVESLVKYLKYLSANETAYKKHLEWRTWVAKPELMEERLKPSNRDYDLRSFCKLCRILQEEEEADRQGRPRRKMVVPSMHEFWWKMENSECLRG